MKGVKLAGLTVTVLVVLVLVGSAAAGLFGGGTADDDAESGTTEEMLVDGVRLRVEVLNGAGVPGLAREVTRQLRRQNFDVVYFGNAPGGARDSSVVIDRVGRIEDAQRVADALGIQHVRSAPDTTLFLEASVVLGREWAAEQAERAAAADRPVSVP